MGAIRSWQSVQEEVLRRINSREWRPGEIIPAEADLAREFGCARATVNRALQSLAEAGLLDRRRKAGTRVALHPVRKATLSIPIIRKEVTGQDMAYGYRLVSHESRKAPGEITRQMGCGRAARLVHVTALHLADDAPYVFEDRWINPAVVPAAEQADFTAISANEWLVDHVPFEGGDIAFSAISASEREAELLGCAQGTGLFTIDRATWSELGVITLVRLTFRPGYRMHTEL